jgi:replicative DNA helicase
MMSDLRESGSIEQDADVILFPFREGYYVNPDDPDSMTEIIFGKVRMGERGSEGLEFQGKFSRFKALDSRVDFAAIRSAREEAEMLAQKDRFKKKSGRGMTL